jgi:hypothetical protein
LRSLWTIDCVKLIQKTLKRTYSEGYREGWNDHVAKVTMTTTDKLNAALDHAEGIIRDE